MIAATPASSASSAPVAGDAPLPARPIEATADEPAPGEAGASLKGVRVLLAEGNAAETTALFSVLEREGAAIEVVTDARDIVTVATNKRPHVLLIDTAMGGLDVGRTTRILARNPVTAPTAVLLVVPGDADGRVERRLKEFDAFGLLRRPMTCDAVRETFRSAAAFGREAERLRKPKPKPGRPQLVDGCDALLRRDLSCPFHSFGVPVAYYQLRSGKAMAETDVFDVPTYKPVGAEGEAFVDYNRVGVAICRECFFASNDPNYFDDPDRGVATVADRGASRASYRIDPATRGKIVTAGGHRGLVAFERLGGEPSDAFFDWRRDDRQALVAYEIAIATSRTLWEAAPVRRSTELLRLGNYELRRALLREKLAAPPARVLKHRAAAGEWLAQAFAKCKGVPMIKAAYQLTAINVHLGRDAVAFRYLQALRGLTKASHREQEDPVTLDRYVRRAQAAWEDRASLRHPDAGALAQAA